MWIHTLGKQLQIHYESVELQKKLIFRIFRVKENSGDSKRKADTKKLMKKRKGYSDWNRIRKLEAMDTQEGHKWKAEIIKYSSFM